MEQLKRMKVKLVLHPDYTEDVRCMKCSALLFKARMPLKKSSCMLGIEVKCRKCGALNRF